jgi:hypothetical protein
MDSVFSSWQNRFLNTFDVIIYVMELHKNLNHLLLAAIIGVCSLGVAYVGRMSADLGSMAKSLYELNIRMGQVSDTVKDHEQRLRDIEHFKKGK